MNSIRYNILITALIIGFGAGTVGQAGATGMVAGATEPTQILNNIELLGSHLKQVQSVGKQIQQYANQGKRLINQVKMMQQLDPTKAGDLLKGVGIGADMAGHLAQRYEAAQEIGNTLTSMSDGMSTLYREGRIAHNVIDDLRRAGHNITGGDYIAAMDVLAKKRADTYGVRIEQVRRASQTAIADADRLKKIAELNPDIVSEIEGLQAIIKTNENLSGLIAYNNQLVTEQVVSQMELNQSQILQIDEAHVRRRQQDEFYNDLFNFRD